MQRAQDDDNALLAAMAAASAQEKPPTPGAGEAAGGGDGAEVSEQGELAPLLTRCLAAAIDGLLLLSLSAFALLSGLRGGGRVRFEGVDWESFYYVWAHLPTLCTVSARRHAVRASARPPTLPSRHPTPPLRRRCARAL